MPQVVISASRRTDIPAFYMSWFMDSIDNGRFDVINPYNQKTYQVPAAPDQVHSIVFWSKNFGPFIDHHYGEALMERGYRLFFNFTINAPNHRLEPEVPPLEERLVQLAGLADRFGPQCIQWRFDPICFYKDDIGQEKDNLDAFDTVANKIAELGISTCITSFVDLYRKVVHRMQIHSNWTLFDPSMQQKVETIAALSRKTAALGIDLKLCCEKEILDSLPADVHAAAAACIPGKRLTQLYGPEISLAKDRGQRRDAGCACSVSKDIGSYSLHPCQHNCLFCYANPSMDNKGCG